jgi:ribosomal protein L11 methyltransferase
MSWMELSLDTTNEAVDWVCTLLATTSYNSDIRVAKYATPDLGEPSEQDRVKPNWAFTICLYLPYDYHSREGSLEIENLLLPLKRTGLTTELSMIVVEEKTAADICSPLVRRIGQRFIVLSPDAIYPQAIYPDAICDSESLNEITLRLKTSLAFGSGLHPATILTLQLLERYILPTMNVLDLGCGSGILSVAIAKLGATVLALDNDIISVESTQDAVRRNQVEHQVTVMEGSLGNGSNLGHWMGGKIIDNVPSIEPAGSFDLIVANILARVHTSLAPDFRRALRRTPSCSSLLILAGFTTDYEEDLTAFLQEEGFEVVDCERLNEWVAIAYRLKQK